MSRLPKNWKRKQAQLKPTGGHQDDITISIQTRDWSWMEDRARARLHKAKARMGVYEATGPDARPAPDVPPA